MDKKVKGNMMYMYLETGLIFQITLIKICNNQLLYINVQKYTAHKNARNFLIIAHFGLL